MADYDRRNGGSRGGYNNRKRRYRGTHILKTPPLLRPADLNTDDDEYDRRPQRRRYEEPLHLKVRKQLLGVAESVSLQTLSPRGTNELMGSKPLKKTDEEINSIAKLVVDNFEDADIQNQFLNLAIQL